MGRSRGGLTSKIHAVVDTNGLPIRVAVSAGEAHDNRLASKLLSRLKSGTMLLADRGYDADWIRALAAKRHAWANIPPRSNRNDPICFSPYLYRGRNLIERFFNKLKQYRRVATRYDKLAANYLAFVQLASIRLWLRLMSPRPRLESAAPPEHRAESRGPRSPVALGSRGVTVLTATGGDASARAAKAATSTIPILFAIGGDPIKAGLVKSFNRPGGNATGVVIFSNDMEAKRLDLLREIVPGVSLFGVLLNPNFPPAAGQLPDLETAAPKIGRRIFKG
jgi:transposase